MLAWKDYNFEKSFNEFSASNLVGKDESIVERSVGSVRPPRRHGR